MFLRLAHILILWCISQAFHALLVCRAIRHMMIHLRFSMSSLGLYHAELSGWLPPCMFLPSEYEYFFGFINMYSLDFCLISSGVRALSFDSVLYVASIVLSSSLLNPSMNFEAMLKFLLFVYSSGSPLLLKLSRSTRNRSIDSSFLCPFVFFFQVSSSLDNPSFLTRID